MASHKLLQIEAMPLNQQDHAQKKVKQEFLKMLETWDFMSGNSHVSHRKLPTL
jgi:hypothetical protein